MKNKFLLIFCSAALLTVMNTSYAASLPTSRGRSQMGGKVAGGGKLCNGKLPGTYANYIGKYDIGYSRDGLPILMIGFSDIVKEISDGDDGIAEAIFVNGRSILRVNNNDGRNRRSGEIRMVDYRFKGDNRVYTIKSGDRVKVVFVHANNLKDTIECTVPGKTGK